MVIGQLGFNPFSAVASGLTSVAKAGARVVTDPRAQQVAAVAAQRYAPDKYAQVQKYANQAQQILHSRVVTPGQMPPPPLPPQGPVMPMPDYNEAPPAQKGNLIAIGAIIGAGLLVFLMMRR